MLLLVTKTLRDAEQLKKKNALDAQLCKQEKKFTQLRATNVK